MSRGGPQFYHAVGRRFVPFRLVGLLQLAWEALLKCLPHREPAISLASSAQFAQVFVETSVHMVQMELVCAGLKKSITSTTCTNPFRDESTTKRSLHLQSIS